MKPLALLLFCTGCYLHHEPASCEPETKRLPEAPRELWAIDSGSDSGPENPSIDPHGRMYFVITHRDDDRNRLIAIEPDGELAWSWTDGSRLRQPTAACHGVGMFATSFVDGEVQHAWLELDREGNELRRAPMPEDIQYDALDLGEDFVISRRFLDDENLRLTRIGRDGTQRWTVHRRGFAFGPPVGNDTLIITRRSYLRHEGEPRRNTLEAFSHAGDSLWTQELEGSVLGPMVVTHDSIYLALARHDGSQTTFALELDGSTRWELDFPETANWQRMGIHERTLILRDRHTMRAVDAYDATELWMTDVHPNIDYGPEFDDEGRLLLSGGFTRVNPRSGAHVWSFNGARRTDRGFAFPTTATIAGDGRIVFGAHNGEIVMIGD